VGVYLGAGFVFSSVLGRITSGLQTLGHVMSWIVVAAIAVYVGYQFHLWIKSRVARAVPRVSASEVARRLYSEESDDVAVYDVRSHGYYDRGTTRIQRSSRLEPNALHQMAESLPPRKGNFPILHLRETVDQHASSA
jgi:hypothetical protein